MERKISLFRIAMVLLLISATSCKEELLDLAPADSVSESTVFDTPDRIEKLLFGTYDAMKQRGFYGSLFMLFSDVRGEDFLNEGMSTGQGLQVWNHTLEETFVEVNTVWNEIYYTINSCNIFIDGIQKNKKVLANDSLAAQYEAEVKFIRALSYFSLLTLYARPYADNSGGNLGVVLRLQPQPGSGEKDQARASVAEVYQKILDDLNFAQENLPESYGNEYDNTTRAHQNTAIALTTRVFLSMGRFAETISEANKLVSVNIPFSAPSGVPHILQENIQNVFIPPYTTTESIFSLPNTSSDPLFSQAALASFFNPPPVGLGDYSLNPEGIVKDEAWWEEDTRRAFISVDAGNGKIYLAKFPSGPPYTDFVPIIRYAEVLLNLSEAITHDCNCVDSRALTLLNAVRVRSNPNGAYAGSDFINSEELISAILKERRIEFLGEGFRSFNLTRLMLPIPGKENVSEVNPSQSEYIWPIPISELAANNLCEPNP